MTDNDWNEQLARARRQAQPGTGDTLSGLVTVLDLLLKGQTDGMQAGLVERLRAETGVVVLSDTARLQPDWRACPMVEARAGRCVVLQDASGTPRWLGAADPWSEQLWPTLQKVARRAGHHLSPAALRGTDLMRWLGAGAASALVAPSVLAGSVASKVSGVGQPADGLVVGFVDAAIRAAWQAGASDIHFECDRQGVTVKLRLDGVMTWHARLEGVQPAEEVISRIKVLAQLDITERRLPQDGRFRFDLGDAVAVARMDLRVSIMPSVFGEDAVLRLLDKSQLRAQQTSVTLESLGFEADAVQLVRELAAEPSGMLLVTGPTGSGKTTTVYAALSEINTGREKIITIEDPVEYELPGVLQIPVNERKGLTFAKGLRSILRHDPDRILVGEIRDAETAEIAVQSALTGHLVFTTVHANGVADIMGRFRHFGLDMFGFMSSLNGVVVQRLMRRVCPACVGQRAPTIREAAWLQQHAAVPMTVPMAVGCSACRATGYKGRFVVAEVHVIDDVFRDHVTEGAPVSVLKQHAYACRAQSGGLERQVESLVAQALRRVLAGETCLEEVKRVVGGL